MAGGHSGAHGGGHGHGGGSGLQHDLLARMGYETRDVETRSILSWLAVLFVFLVMATGGTLLLYRVFVPAELVAQTRGQGQRPSRVPLQPQVQMDPKRDMRQFRQAEEAALVGGVTTREGLTTVPVDVAIDRLAESGISGISGTALPTPPAGAPGSGQFETTSSAARRQQTVGLPVTGATATGAAQRAYEVESLQNIPSSGEAAPAANTNNQQFRMMYGGER